MRNKKRSLLKKYQLGTLGTSFGGFNSPTFETWSPSTSSPTYTPTDPSVYLNSSVVPEDSFLLKDYSNKSSNNSSEIAGGVAGGVAGGLGAVAAGLSSSAAGMRANTRSEIDPRSIYAYDPSKSGFQQHKYDAKMTAQVLGAAGGVASSIPNPIAQIIGAGLGVGAAGTEMGLADLEQRLVRAHDAKYKERINVGGRRGDFTTQGQFTTMEDPGRNITQAKMGGYLDKYRGGGLYANIHAKRARIKAGSGEKMRSPGEKGAPTAANFERAAKTAKKQMGGSVPEYGASGMVEYGKGGIYMDPAKKGMGGYLKSYQMGSNRQLTNEDLTRKDEEAIQRYLDSSVNRSKEMFGFGDRSRDSLSLMNRFSKTGSFYDPYNREFYQKENVNLGKEPTPLSEMKKGGMAVSNGVPRKYANAELEGGEVIEKQTGPDVYVKGPSHENGGVPMRLQEGGPARGGDYVWSDHLTFKGKTMAELYAMAVQNGASEEEIDQLRMLQEQLAGRAGEPQDAKELQEMPAAKTGGMLKKYQTGTNSRTLPDGTEMPILSDSEYDRIMKEKQMKDLEALRNSDEYNEGMANLSWAPGSAANVATGSYGKLPSKEEVEREKAMKRSADAQYYKEQGLNAEGQPYSDEDLKSANVGEVGSGRLLSKTGTQIYGKRSAGDKAMELLPYGAAVGGVIAQLAATLGAKNPYKGLKTPKANLVPTPEKQFFERTDSRVQEAANQRGAALSKQLLQQAGFGPGETAALQKVELDRAAADAQATQQAREFNIQQDRAEKQLNTEMKLRADMANQAALNERNMQEYQRQLSERGFETERAMSVGDVVSGAMKDVASYGSDANFARAIYGDSGIGQRAWNYDPVQARAEIMAENPQKDGESASEYQSRISKLERENAKKYNDEYMKTVANRRRRYTQMRSQDGEQS